MTLEEKIAHLQSTSMERARAECTAIIDKHHEALKKVFEDHKEEAMHQSETRIKAETLNASQQLNKAMAKSQLDLKRSHGKVLENLKDKIFKEATELVHDFMKTEAYTAYLLKHIHQAVAFAAGDSMVIYINPSDEHLLESLENACGLSLMISTRDFVGGIRAVIKERNILIDNSFMTALKNEYDEFIFSGGDSLA